MAINKIELNYKFDSVTEFYAACLKKEEGINEDVFERISEEDDSSFKGLSNKDILKHKYSYQPGLKKLRDISDLTAENLGGNKYNKKWDEFDGDDMSYERLLEGDPALLLKTKVKGNNKQGKFISVQVCISENACVSSSQMLWKTYTAAKIIETLEKEGFRVEVIIVINIKNPGSFKKSKIGLLKVDITLKKYSNPVNIPLLITCISPWFFRHWVFKFIISKIYADEGLGQSIPLSVGSSNKNIIVINRGECLSEEGSIQKIKDVKNNLLK